MCRRAGQALLPNERPGTDLARPSGMKKNRFKVASESCAALIALGCARGPLLEPAAGSLQPRDMPGAVMAQQSQVRVVAQAREWPGPARIAEVVAPLRIIIENGSQKPLQIRYSSFEIVAPAGDIYRAIPPRRVRGVVDTEEYIRPGFTYGRFYAAPYYHGYYSGVPTYPGPFVLDGAYHEYHYGYWDGRAVLPTPQMIARALPEGVLDPGGRLDGYVYFEKPQQKQGTGVNLRVELRSVDGSEPFISVTLPFVLDHTPR